MTTRSRRIDKYFEVRAVDGFDDGSWWWELYADGDFLDGGGWASTPYPTAESALDVGEELIRESLDAELIRRGMSPTRVPDRRTFSTAQMTDPREIVASSWLRTHVSSGRPLSLINAETRCVNFYVILPDGSGQARVVCVEDPPLWNRLLVPLAHEKLGRDGADDEFVVDALEMQSLVAESMRQSQARGVDVSADLAEINAHRRLIGMAPLDPGRSGWTDEDVQLEAKRIRTLNPLDLAREVVLAW